MTDMREFNERYSSFYSHEDKEENHISIMMADHKEAPPLVTWYRQHENAVVPVPHTEHSAGVDLAVCFSHLIDEGKSSVFTLPHSKPTRSYEVKASGYDSVLKNGDDALFICIKKGEKALIPTGLRCVIRPGYEMQIRPRSSIYKKDFIIVNSPGTVDSDYRGEIFIAVKAVDDDVIFKEGDRIAQAVFHKLPTYTYDVKDGIPDDTLFTSRGTGGFGSTG